MRTYDWSKAKPNRFETDHTLGYGPRPNQLGERLEADHYHKMFNMQSTDLIQLKVETRYAAAHQSNEINIPLATLPDNHVSVAHTPPSHAHKQDAPSFGAGLADPIEEPIADNTPQPGVEDVTPDLHFIKVNAT